MKKYLPLIAVCCAAFFVAVSLRLAVKKWAPNYYAIFWGQPQPIIHHAQQNPTVPPAEQTQNQQPKPPPPPPRVEEAPADAIYATGRIWNSKNSWVVMSDGTNRSLDDNTEDGEPRLQRVRRHFMDYDGKRYYYKPKAGGTATAPEKPRNPDTVLEKKSEEM